MKALSNYSHKSFFKYTVKQNWAKEQGSLNLTQQEEQEKQSAKDFRCSNFQTQEPV